MRSNVIPKLIASAILTCSVVATMAQEVHYNYDRDADFAIYKTYQWAERDRRPGDQLMDGDIRRAIDGQLAQRGLQRVADNGALYIQYQTAIDKERQVDAWSMGPRWSGMARANTSTIDIGTLIVSIYDPAKKQLVWRGSATKSLDIKKDPDKNYKNLEKAVAKLLRNFPPNLSKK